MRWTSGSYYRSNFDIKILFILFIIYDEKLIPTSFTRRTLKKLIIDTCTKTVFSVNGIYHEQIDGVSMGSSLGPVLANRIMTELENLVIKPLVNDGTIKFYGRYVDDTLLEVWWLSFLIRL